MSATVPAAKPDYAGLRSYTKARSTGTHVGVYDGIAAGMDTDASPDRERIIAAIRDMLADRWTP